MIRYLKHKEIDREKWDQCIAGASFETMYPYSWYLDLVSPGWEGLVGKEYEMVMPLTWTRKFGFDFLLQPILAQQLGVFSVNPPTEAELLEFLEAIPSRFRYVDICLNCLNTELQVHKLNMDRVNYELRLDEPGISYNTNTKRNLEKGRANNFVLRDLPVSRYLDLYYSSEKKIPVQRAYLENPFEGLKGMGRAGAFGLFLDDELHAAAVLGYAKSRVIYMNGTTTPLGKESRAMFVLMDHLIESSRGKFPLFDFEGSNIPGVARFFEGFGGRKILFPRIVRTKFPFFRFKS
ncbi:hypothetical protein ACFLTU_03475 [Bacteroidota bacterium]